ncbi:hypothetical protein OAN24_05645 [Pseudodesulfovibrio sp.]|nr:hypothetical protein [Pseudodesulfovibrio sp.]
MQPVNEANPIAHFEPNRTSTWSRFADFSMVNTVHSNNYGFINDLDYDPKGREPLIAVIGDSYVEATMVPYKETLHGRLSTALESKWRVYSFGVSGAPLSQYLVVAQFVRDEFKPNKMVFVVVGNDFDESLRHIKASQGLHLFEQHSNNQLTLERQDYSPGLLRRILRHSHLALYLFTNAQIQHFLAALTQQNKTFVGQTDASVSSQRVNKSKQVVDTFFRTLPEASGLPTEEVCFILDGMRPHLYSAKGIAQADGSYFQQMRDYFIKIATSSGYIVTDLQPAFIQDYAQNGARFEFPRDGHWNAAGHAIAAQAAVKCLDLNIQ